ncbi:MAG: hypothetical protein QG573_1789 [Acidobacteriota bacterium]|nr:hypothetical protein [Acidobacteriota bacterium]
MSNPKRWAIAAFIAIAVIAVFGLFYPRPDDTSVA